MPPPINPQAGAAPRPGALLCPRSRSPTSLRVAKPLLLYVWLAPDGAVADELVLEVGLAELDEEVRRRALAIRAHLDR